MSMRRLVVGLEHSRRTGLEDDIAVVDVTRFVEEPAPGAAKAANSRGRPGNDATPSVQPDDKVRNLVVCIDGTANQFGLKVSCQYTFDSEHCG